MTPRAAIYVLADGAPAREIPGFESPPRNPNLPSAGGLTLKNGSTYKSKDGPWTTRVRLNRFHPPLIEVNGKEVTPLATQSSFEK